MLFTNDTDHPAGLLRTEHRGTQIATSLIVRVRHLIEDGRLIRPTGEDRLADLRREPVSLGDHGTLPPDNFYPRHGTDVIVLGDAVARGRPTEAMRVDVSVGPYHVALDVLGDRHWEKRLGDASLTPSAAAPFERMPVTFRNAFGGVAAGQYGPIPTTNNPVGKGYYLSRDEALGGPLPNIEAPDRRIKSWDDAPDPAGIGPYPFEWGLRLFKVFHLDRERKVIDARPEEGMFNAATPILSGRRVEPGPMRVTGMSARGAVELAIPPCPFEVQVILGEKSHVRDLLLEEVLVDLRDVDAGRGSLDLTYRKMFHYEFQPLTIRHTILQAKKAPE